MNITSQIIARIGVRVKMVVVSYKGSFYATVDTCRIGYGDFRVFRFPESGVFLGVFLGVFFGVFIMPRRLDGSLEGDGV